jgi:hypothetical protein
LELRSGELNMWNKFKCWLGLHSWKTCIGEGAELRHPPCRYCGIKYRLTQGQVDEYWQLVSEKKKIQAKIDDLMRE